MDNDNHTPMMRQFYSIKKEHQDKILFYRMGDFYEMFGEDAVVAAKVLQIALTSRNKNSANSVPMCGVPYHAYEQYLNKLSAAGYKVAICEQTEDPALAKGLVSREVVRIVTPGTTVSPQLLPPDQNHYLLALRVVLPRKIVGMAFVDVSTGEFEVAEFSLDNLLQVYDFLYQLHPQEILLPHSRSEQESRFFEQLQERVQSLSFRNGSSHLFSFLEPFYFDAESGMALLKDQFQTLNLAGFGVESLDIALTAAGALVRYLGETQKCGLSHITTIRQHTFDEAMFLDEITIANLELFDSNTGEKRHTLYHVLNHTQTAMGARLLRQWLRTPLLEMEAITQRYDAIDEFQDNFILCEDLRTLLKQIQDLLRILGRITLPVAGIADFCGLRESLEPIQSLPEYLSHFHSPLLASLAQDLDPLSDILDLLN
ncbi:MAG: DNA mismatch repair protein MutS, partial [SAR324 cluster bacterium]|nr:DNA mismatch repair protein MutS [SAR324 cluster bacterium]